MVDETFLYLIHLKAGDYSSPAPSAGSMVEVVSVSEKARLDLVR
jgi:hypothetical protein